MRFSHITLAVAMIAMGSATAQMHDSAGNAIVRRNPQDTYGQTSPDDSTGDYGIPEAESSSSMYPTPTAYPHEVSPQEHNDYPADTSNEHDLKGEPMYSPYPTLSYAPDQYPAVDAESSSTSCSSSSTEYPEPYATPAYGSPDDTEKSPKDKNTPDYKDTPENSPEYQSSSSSTTCKSKVPKETPYYSTPEADSKDMYSTTSSEYPQETPYPENSPEYQSSSRGTTCKSKVPKETPYYSTPEADSKDMYSTTSSEYPQETPYPENSPEYQSSSRGTTCKSKVPKETPYPENSPEYQSSSSSTTCKSKVPKETPYYSTPEADSKDMYSTTSSEYPQETPYPENSPEYTVTVITTDYVTVCSTGLKTVQTVYTTMVPVSSYPSYPEDMTTTTTTTTKTKTVTRTLQYPSESSSTVYPDTTTTCMEGAYCPPTAIPTYTSTTLTTSSCKPRKTVTSYSTTWVEYESKTPAPPVYSAPSASGYYPMVSKNSTAPLYTPPSTPYYAPYPSSKKEVDAKYNYPPSPAPVASASGSGMPYDVKNSTTPTAPVYSLPPVATYTGGAMRQGMSMGALTLAVAGVVGLVAFM
ncbi:hypothetical protein K440DRAFT_659327 [Wilcoxina mikolae CBS 423.85]|nr:hypothetical protein K440DRAFT_659327 [Wilcoxina mikolae CBS 423.85]